MATCTHCHKESRVLSFDIDYSPTKHLLDRPLTFCEKPNIKYKLSRFDAYWAKADLQKFLNHALIDMSLHAYCWFWDAALQKRMFVKLKTPHEIDDDKNPFLGLYFSLNPLDMASLIAYTNANDKGVYLHEGLWRNNELVELSGPCSMHGVGTGYFIHFCTQYLDKGEVVDKSKAFTQLTTDLKAWLSQNFITERGKNCFDGASVFERWQQQKKNRD